MRKKRFEQYLQPYVKALHTYCSFSLFPIIHTYCSFSLFPTMPRHNYHKVAPLVQSLCKKHNCPYVVKPLSTAMMDIVRYVKSPWLILKGGQGKSPPSAF